MDTCVAAVVAAASDSCSLRRCCCIISSRCRSALSSANSSLCLRISVSYSRSSLRIQTHDGTTLFTANTPKWPLFRTIWVSWHQKGYKDFKKTRDDGDAVASAGTYANHLLLAADRQPCQHLITRNFYRPDAVPDAQSTVSKHWKLLLRPKSKTPFRVKKQDKTLVMQNIN